MAKCTTVLIEEMGNKVCFLQKERRRGGLSWGRKNARNEFSTGGSMEKRSNCLFTEKTANLEEKGKNLTLLSIERKKG